MDNGRESVAKITLAAVLIYAIAHFFLCRSTLARAEGELERAAAKYAQLCTENELLTEKAVNGYTPQELEAMARRRLGFIKDGEIVFYFDIDRED